MGGPAQYLAVIYHVRAKCHMCVSTCGNRHIFVCMQWSDFPVCVVCAYVHMRSYAELATYLHACVSSYGEH